ncbi:MAG: DUF5667 domain-containing protein [Candidatus Dormibacteraceae bacterium]
MDLDGEGLSPIERELAAQLSQLGTEPTLEQRASIMAAVRSSQVPRRAVIGRWRPVLVVFAAAALLVVTCVGALAASSDALPSSPTYSLRVFSEQVRLALASPASRQQLRIAFASTRIKQARATLSQGDRSDATELLRDSRDYLAQTKKELGDMPPATQGQIQNQLNEAEADEHQAETQLNQEGPQES